MKTVSFNLHDFTQIRTSLVENATFVFLHSHIYSYIDYCITSWLFTSVTTLKSIESCFEKVLKVLDKKPFSYHHCSILAKCNLLSFGNFLPTACLIYIKFCMDWHHLHWTMCQAEVSQWLNYSDNYTDRGECEVPFRQTSFSQNALSFKGCALWNSIPLSVRKCSSFVTFNSHLKLWLWINQTWTSIIHENFCNRTMCNYTNDTSTLICCAILFIDRW